MEAPDDSYLFVAEADAKAQASRIQGSSKTAGQPIDFKSKILALKRRGEILYLGHANTTISVFNLENGEKIKVLRGHSGPVSCLELIDQDTLASGSWDKTIILWDLKTFEKRATLSGHNDFVKSLLYAGRKTLFSGTSDKTIGKWDLENNTCTQTLKGHSMSVEALDLDSGNCHLLSGSSDGTIRKWDLQTGQPLQVLNGHLTSVYGMYVDREGDVLWTVSADKTVKRWNLETNQPEISFEHPDFVRSVISYGPVVVTGCRDCKIRIWDIATEKCVQTISGHSDDVTCLDIYCGQLLSASLDGTLRRWNCFSAKKEDEAPISQSQQPPTNTTLTEEEERELNDLMSDDNMEE